MIGVTVDGPTDEEDAGKLIENDGVKAGGLVAIGWFAVNVGKFGTIVEVDSDFLSLSGGGLGGGNSQDGESKGFSINGAI